MLQSKFKLPMCLTLIVLALSLWGCSTQRRSGVSDEVSLKADRSYLDHERDQIPEGVREENDFLALVLKDMATVSKEPSRVRDNFFKETRKVREKFNRDQRKKREAFNKDERSKREKFLDNLKRERESFSKKKHDREKSKEFFQKLNTDRSVFFDAQKDVRKEFESSMAEVRRDFNEDMQLKQKTFDDAYREYQKKYTEFQNRKRDSVKNRGNIRVSPPQERVEQYPGQFRDLEDLNR